MNEVEPKPADRLGRPALSHYRDYLRLRCRSQLPVA